MKVKYRDFRVLKVSLPVELPLSEVQFLTFEKHQRPEILQGDMKWKWTQHARVSLHSQTESLNQRKPEQSQHI